jgi:hypothetical protein
MKLNKMFNLKDKDPVNPKDEKDPSRELIDEKSDNFSSKEQTEILRMIEQDIEADKRSMAEWAKQRVKDIQMYDGIEPSLIENLEKKEWMSDRNLGLVAANCDAYQATLLSTCYNIDTIHFNSEATDSNYTDNLEKFAKWGLGEKEANFFPEVDDFIHNKVTQGISYFYIYWEVKYEWVDRRIPVHNKDGDLLKYNIKTEKIRRERGVIKNISDVSDLLYPAHGDSLQTKEHLIYRTHKTAAEILKLGQRKIFLNIDEDYVMSLKKHYYDTQLDEIRDEKKKNLGISGWESVTDMDLRQCPIDVFHWFGPYEKNGRYEEYRFTVEIATKKFLAGKPLRKITRSGKRPFVGRPFIKRPGLLPGRSLPDLIADPTNALNNTYNQKSDFQYVENCPFGFYDPEEQFKNQTLDILPGTLIPTQDPNSINIPNLTRSLAWAEADFNFLLQIIERLTGAASYFMSNTQGVSGTATRDAIINEKSETRFGLWVKRIMSDLSEAVTMWMEMYQDWGPRDLGERVLGEDGKALFKNFSIETLRGSYVAKMNPDIISGSKTLDKEIAIWALENLSMSPWFDPMMNPKGSWHLTANAGKKVGFTDIEKIMPPEPKSNFQDGKVVSEKWQELTQGSMPEIEPTDDLLELYMGFMSLNDTKRDTLDPEYIPNLDLFMFKLQVGMVEFMRKQEMEKQSNAMAMEMVGKVNQGQMTPEEAVDA